MAKATRGPKVDQPRTLRGNTLAKGTDPAGFGRRPGPNTAPGPDMIELSTQAGCPLGPYARPFGDEQRDRDAQRLDQKVPPATAPSFKLKKL